MPNFNLKKFIRGYVFFCFTTNLYTRMISYLISNFATKFGQDVSQLGESEKND